MIRLIWLFGNDLRPLPKKVMEKKNNKGRITFVEVSTEELIDFFVQNTSAEIETSGGIGRIPTILWSLVLALLYNVVISRITRNHFIPCHIVIIL